MTLVPLIYDAAEEPGLWPEVLNQVGAAFRASAKLFSMEDLSGRPGSISLNVGIDPTYQRLYEQHYNSINIHIQRARPLLRPCLALATHQFCPEGALIASEYYQDFLRLQDSWFHILGGCIARDESLVCIINFMKGRSAGQFTNDDIRLLDKLMPHFQRAARLRSIFALHESIASCLNLLPLATLLVDGCGQVTFTNTAADAMVQKGDGLGIDKQGRLTTPHKGLRDLITAACRTVSGNGGCSGGTLLVPRPSGKRPYAVSVSPVRQCRPIAAARNPGAVVFVTDPEMEPESIGSMLVRLYGLTAAEARIASLLVEGKDISQICGDLRVRRTTARTHLGRVLDKLGVKRQAEAVSLVLRTFGRLPSGSERNLSR